MNTTNISLSVSGIDIEVVFKDIKNLHIGVYPPDGRVRVSAPTRMDVEQVRMAVIQRLGWIKRQQADLQASERQSTREMVAGESHYVWGRRYRLSVVERPGRNYVDVDGDRLVLSIEPGTEQEKRRSVLERWYRQELRGVLTDTVARWEAELDVKVPRWGIRRMKTKWGSCNRETGHLWFNLELAKKHPHCVEYVVVHEMNHYFERHHGDRFIELMDRSLPDWRQRRDELNSAPLKQESWRY